MKKNMGVTDRIIRVIIGIALVLAGLYLLPGIWAIVAYVIAAIMLITSAIGLCPLYLPFKISTNRKKNKK